MPNNAVLFAKRSFSLSKIQSVMGIVIALGGVLVLNAGKFLNEFSIEYGKLALISVAPMALGILLFTIPVVLLYVYDKNNGVLEYLLSLGWNQSDIFKRYLKASLFLALTLFAAEFAANIVLSAVVGTQIVTVLIVSAVTAALGFSAVSFVTVAMVSFSSLVKQRVGANSPLAVTLGVAVIDPTFFLQYILPFSTVVFIELLIAAIVGAVSIVLLMSSSRLVRREKMLP